MSCILWRHRLLHHFEYQDTNREKSTKRKQVSELHPYCAASFGFHPLVPECFRNVYYSFVRARNFHSLNTFDKLLTQASSTIYLKRWTPPANVSGKLYTSWPSSIKIPLSLFLRRWSMKSQTLRCFSPCNQYFGKSKSTFLLAISTTLVSC